MFTASLEMPQTWGSPAASSLEWRQRLYQCWFLTLSLASSPAGFLQVLSTVASWTGPNMSYTGPPSHVI